METKPVVIRETAVREYLVGRELTDEECQQAVRLLKPGEKGDLILKRSLKWGGYISNVPRRIQNGWFVAWGYSGTGAFDLALNVLYHFSGQNEAFTRKFARLFVIEVVSKLPMSQAIRLDERFVSSWVEQKMNASEDQLSHIGAPYVSGVLSADHLVWDNSFQQILAPAEIA